MKTDSYDLRERVVRACDAGRGTRQQRADLFGVRTAWIRRLLQRRRETGSFAAPPHAGGPAPTLDPDRRGRLAVLITEQPDATWAEPRDRLGTAVPLSTIARALTRLGLTVKNQVPRAAEHDRPDVRHKRAPYRGRAARLGPARSVCLDETGLNTAMTRLRGRAPRGARLVGKVPPGDWQATTWVAGVRPAGLVAPLALMGAMDAAPFESYGAQVLVPCLRPGDLVVLDRLSAHRGAAVARAIRRVGAGVGYLPPYSPDSNPIAHLGSKVQGALRKVAARTTEALGAALPAAVAAVTAQEGQHSFAHCGYHATPVCAVL